MNEEFNNNTDYVSQEGEGIPNFTMQSGDNAAQDDIIYAAQEQNPTQEQVSSESEYVSYQEGVHMNDANSYSDGNQENGFYQQAYSPASYSVAGNGQAGVKKPKKVHRVKKDTFGRRAMRVVASALCFGLIAGGIMTGMQYGAGKLWGGSGSNSVSSTPTLTTTDSNSKDTVETASSGSVSKVVENVVPSIVSITSTVQTTSDSWFFGGGQTQDSTSCGSGIIISKSDSELLVVTNNHVIEGANAIKVGFSDDETVTATVKGTDSSSDLAVLSVKLSDMKDSTLSAIKIAVLGDSSKLTVGQDVIAIGNALGYGQSVTTGVVSALDREVTTTDYTMKLLQTDAAINPGNSGGALLNMNGEVIGINSVKYSSSEVEGMGYAIPMSTASPIINDLMNEEVIPKAEQAYLGISGSDIDNQLAQMYSMPKGVWVSEVAGGSPAETAGLQQRDIITEFDGKEISNMQALQQYIAKNRSGDKVTIKVQRQGGDGEYKEVELNVTLGSKSENVQ